MSRTRYIDDVDCDRTVDALAHAGRMTRDEVTLIQGEVGNIWPRTAKHPTRRDPDRDG